MEVTFLMLVPVNDFCLNGTEGGESEVWFQSRRISSVSARCIEAQYDLGFAYLLILSEDSPYEEILRIILFDHAFAILDAVSIGEPGFGWFGACGRSGVFVESGVLSDNTLHFSFYSDRDHWQLRVHSQQTRLARVRGLAARRSWRFALGGHYLELRQLPDSNEQSVAG
jgi:hypothetical protein